MNNIVRKVLETYLNEQKILSLEELWITNHEYTKTKDCSFVTIYKNGKVIASSGRVNVRKPNTILELIENTLFCLKDPRFTENIKTPDEIKNVFFRVDIISSNQRQVINKISEIEKEVDIKKNWLILISQNLWKVSVILPNITNLISNSKDLFNLLCKKANLDPNTIKEEDYILYKIETTIFSDF